MEAKKLTAAATDVLAERQRQQSVEGWTPEHDDDHCNGELAMAAVCYINETGTVNRNGGKPWGWPWDASWWKKYGRLNKKTWRSDLRTGFKEAFRVLRPYGVKGD